MPEKVGFIGMGIMGWPMAFHVLKAGYELMVYNRTFDKSLTLAKEGAKVAESPRDLAQWSDIIIMMVTGPEAVEQIVFGEEGILSARVPARILINMSTVPPAYISQLDDRLKAHFIRLVDAPVSGSRKSAEDAGLIILAGGDSTTVRDCEPLFKCMGRSVIYCGGIGKGSCMKLAVNLLLAVMMAGFCESVNFGMTCGVDPDSLLEVILSGPMSCELFSIKSEMVKSGRYPVQFPFKHMTKDLRFVLQTADQTGAAVPVAHSVFQLYRQGINRDLSDMDFSAVLKIIEDMGSARHR